MDPRYRKPDPRATSTPPQRQGGIKSQTIEYAVVGVAFSGKFVYFFIYFFTFFGGLNDSPPGYVFPPFFTEGRFLTASSVKTT